MKGRKGLKIKDYIFLTLVIVAIMVFGFALGRSYTRNEVWRNEIMEGNRE